MPPDVAFEPDPVATANEVNDLSILEIVGSLREIDHWQATGTKSQPGDRFKLVFSARFGLLALSNHQPNGFRKSKAIAKPPLAVD